MDGLLKKIYENVLLEEAYTLELRKKIDTDVELRLKNYHQFVEDETYDALRSDFFASCYTAEQIGFHIGILFMQRFYSECKHD